jgi:phosphate:Na+ symporter
MGILINIFKLLAGTGLFLFAMYLLEESLKNLSGRNFKLFLQRISKNRLGAITGGAVVTTLLQSSSVVSLMVLAFVGAGVFSMKNAMAIILGANLGTTISSWLIATLGFKVNIEILAYPLVFIGGLLLIFFNNRKSLKYLSYFLFGFGLLFIGLSFMKTAMETQVTHFDFSSYQQLPLITFLVIGFIITMVVQSSSVTMALTLSALYAGAVGFEAAAAIVLGSETGTTIKLMLGGMGGNASKKRIVLGNIIFNIFLTVLAFLLLKPIVNLITNVFNIHNPLIGLVTFSSLVNLLSIAIFIPILPPFIKLLGHFFKDADGSTSAFINHAHIAEPVTAIDLFRRETAYFIHNSILFNLGLFGVNTTAIQKNSDFYEINKKRKFSANNSKEKYAFLKQLQGELQAFYLALREKLQGEQIAQFNQLNSAVRSAMHSAKSIKDIGSNISNLKRSSKDIKYNFFKHHQTETKKLYHQLYAFITAPEKPTFQDLQHVYDDIEHNYVTALNDFYKEVQNSLIEDIDITTVINFNRELFTSNKAMLMAIKDFLLDEKDAKNFNKVPVYTT